VKRTAAAQFVEATSQCLSEFSVYSCEPTTWQWPGHQKNQSRIVFKKIRKDSWSHCVPLKRG